MAGGKQPVNIFKLNRGNDPPEVLNWRLWFAVFSFGLMGAARGVDEGLISGTLASTNFLALTGLDKMAKTDPYGYAQAAGNISAMVQIGSMVGAFCAFLICDRVGRLWATRELCTVWIVGIVIFMTSNGNLGQIYAGRFLAGIGIGQTCVVAPVYLSEIAPKSLRGLCTATFSGSVYIGIMLAYFATYGSAVNISASSTNRWIVPTSLHLMFAGIILILSFFNSESPRYLVKKGKDEQAIKNLAKIRGLQVDHPAVVKEISEIQAQLNEEMEATMGQGWLGVLKEMFLMPNNLYRIYLGLMSQILSQWSGANSITIYAPTFFAILGVTGDEQKLLATAVFGIVKFVAAIICAFFLVDALGRKRALGIGIGLQAFSMAYIALFLSIAGSKSSYTGSQGNAATGGIVMIYVSGFGWAMGWNTMQYLLNAEIYPLRIRAVSSSIVMCFHFINQYGNTKAVPLMRLDYSQGGITNTGTFWFFTTVTLVGGVWMWFQIPETAQLSLESIDKLFTLPWYKIGRYGRKVADVQINEDDGKITAMQNRDGVATHIEKVQEV